MWFKKDLVQKIFLFKKSLFLKRIWSKIGLLWLPKKDPNLGDQLGRMEGGGDIAISVQPDWDLS